MMIHEIQNVWEKRRKLYPILPNWKVTLYSIEEANFTDLWLGGHVFSHNWFMAGYAFRPFFTLHLLYESSFSVLVNSSRSSQVWNKEATCISKDLGNWQDAFILKCCCFLSFSVFLEKRAMRNFVITNSDTLCCSQVNA